MVYELFKFGQPPNIAACPFDGYCPVFFPDLKREIPANALGLKRSTAWTIIKMRHKLGRLNRPTAQRILENPATPAPIRKIIQQALAKSSVATPQSEGGNK